MITIIDYGLGNLRSVQKAIERLNYKAVISGTTDDIEKANKLILPGVGHFSQGIKNIKKYGLLEILNQKITQNKIPILGICLGMQLMTEYSEEGNCKGLGWINARTKKFNFDNNNLKVPHMGWNTVIPKKENNVFKCITVKDTFYFVHSYYVLCENIEDILFKTNYGIEFHSAFQKDNVIGVQFHPEKSHSSGLKLLSEFIKM